MSTAVVWVLTSGSYIVSSIVHLRCIAAGGSGFSASGSIPTYASATYKQTANIDCSEYAGSMIPIGSIATPFNGNYDGQNYEIQNWQNNQNSTAYFQAIFGYIANTSCVIKNISITGICKVKAGGDYCGLLIGQIRAGKVNNINLNLSQGSTVNGKGYVGGVIGQALDSNTTNKTMYVEKIRLKGYLNISGTTNVGGVIGVSDSRGSNSFAYIRDIISSITGNIYATTNAAGIIGAISGTNCYMYGLINEMTGNISGSSQVAGILAYSTSSLYAAMNRMIGNITGGSFTDGITIYATPKVEDCINIMQGNISSSPGNGISSSVWQKRNVLAMKGNALGIIGTPTTYANNVFSNRFGMTINNATVTTNNYASYDLMTTYPSTLTTTGYFKTFDTVNSVPVWTYSYTDGLGNTRTITSTDTNIIQIVNNIPWTFTNGYYEISSVYHLITLLQNGICPNSGTYINSGTYPSINNWFQASYKQTSNIDFNNSNLCSTVTNSLSNFSGYYDGQNYTINNLLYSNKGVSSNATLFYTINNATIKNITLSGSLNVYGNNANDRGNLSYGGIVYTASNNNIVENCKIITSGTILIDNSLSLICNNTLGSNNVIYNCFTNHTGLINTTATGSNISGIILGKGYSSSNNYVLHCTNQNIGNSYLGEYYGGGIAGSNATVFGCINKSIGDLDGHSSNQSYYTSAIAGNGNIIGCINDIIGNIGLNSKTSNVGGISSMGDIDYSINCMTGNLNSNSGYGIGKLGKITNSLNYMWGYTYDVIGGNIITSSNNYCAMSGTACNVINSNYNKYYVTKKYGFSNNNISSTFIRDDIWNLHTPNSYITYFDATTLPILNSNLKITINNSNYVGPASNWEISLPNTNSTYTQFKYQYNTLTNKYNVLQQLKNNQNINTIVPTIADGTNSSTVPFYLLNLAENSNITSYKATLDSIIATSTNKIKTVEEAAFYHTLSNQKYINKNTSLDFAQLTNSIAANKNLLKPAISNALKELVLPNSTQLIKNLDNTIFNTIISNSSNDKLYIPSNIKLIQTELDSLFLNQSELLLLESTIYTIDLNGSIIKIDTTQATASNKLTIEFNSNNYILNNDSNSINIEYQPNIWKKINLTAIGSGSIQILNSENTSKLYSFNFAFNETKTTYANIGIGTTNPQKTLDIAGDINFSGNLYLNNSLLGTSWYKENTTDIKYNENGNIGIGQNTGQYKLDVYGTIRANSYLTVSDLRLKENIEDEYLGLEFIKLLNPKTFSYINDTTSKRRHGFIAQEIIEDDLVSIDNNGIMAINLNSLIAPITKSIQELSIEYNNLQKELLLLQNKQ